jgi:hypothetical protein
VWPANNSWPAVDENAGSIPVNRAAVPLQRLHSFFNQLDGPGLSVLLQHEIEPEQETQQPEIGLDGRRETR